MSLSVLMTSLNFKYSLANIQKNILLAPYTTFKIGGPAKYFFIAKNKNDLIKAIKWARTNHLLFFVLAGGSNILASDEGFDGLVIKFQVSSFKFQRNKIVAEAGVSLNKIIIESIKRGLTGFEWAVGIPGTVGGAVYGNAGAYSHSISESIDKVTAFSPQKLSIKKYANTECKFTYRSSIFKKNKDIILEVELKLPEDNQEKIQKRIKEYLESRVNKIPSEPSAGSIFKNLKIQEQNAKFQKMIPQEKIKSGMVPAGYLIEQCGLKGRRQGNAQISEKHANFIVNLGNAQAKDVIDLIKLCQKEVKKKFGVKLEEEIQYLN